jgi:hypothetical protein
MGLGGDCGMTYPAHVSHTRVRTPPRTLAGNPGTLATSRNRRTRTQPCSTKTAAG